MKSTAQIVKKMPIDNEKAIDYISKEVRKLRNKPKISSEDYLGWAMGLSQGTISKILKKKFRRLPDHYTLQAIANYMDIPYWELIKAIEEANYRGVDEKENLNYILCRIHLSKNPYNLNLIAREALKLERYLAYEVDNSFTERFLPKDV